MLLVLDQVDYMHRACSLTDAVGAVLPADVIDIARASLARSTVDVDTVLYLLEQLAERGSFPDEYRPRLVALCERVTGEDPPVTADKIAVTTVQLDDPYVDGTRRQKISISIDPDLLRCVDTYAKKHGLNRSALLSISVSTFMDNKSD